MRQVIKIRLERQGTRGSARCEARGHDVRSAWLAVASFQPGPPPKTRLVPASGKPVMSEASRVKCPKVFGLEVVHVALAAGTGEDLDLGGQGMEEVGDALGRLLDYPAGRRARDPEW